MSKARKKTKEKKEQIPPTSGFTQHKGGKITALIQHKAIAALFLFLISFGVFVPSLKSDFVWDDTEYIEKSSYSLKVSKITSETLIPEIKGSDKGSHYRPMLRISWIIDNEIWGISPFGFHLSNVIFYSISTVLFYFLALFVLGEFKVDTKEATAFLSSLFFALYPTHVESVSFIAARADLLCSLFFFLALIFHILSHRKLGFLVLAAFCFSFSLLSKEIAVAFPIVALGFDLLSRRLAVRRDNILKYAVYGVLIFVYFYLRERAFVVIPELSKMRVQQSVQDGFQVWGVLRVLLSSYLFYISKLVFPFNSNPFISTLPTGFYYLVSSILVILLLCVIGFMSIRKREGITAFSIFWIFVTIGPSSLAAVFAIGATPVAERFLYIPSAGYCILIGYLILQAGRRIKAQKAAWAFGFLLCISYLFFTIKGQSVWKNNLTLWEEASKRSPDYAYPHVNYGTSLLLAGKTDEAIREFLIALEPGVKSDNRQRAYTANGLGIVYAGKKRDYENAEKWFHRAISYDPKFFRSYYNLGVNYFIKGKSRNSVSDYRKAEEYLKKTLEMRESSGRTHLFLAKVYIELGEREKAKEYAKKALQSGLVEPLAKEAQYILEMNN